MKFSCPICSQLIPADQVNISTDLGYCPECQEGFRLSEGMGRKQEEVIRPVEVNGTWFSQERDEIKVGASTRSPIAFFLVPFMLVWSGGSLGGIYGSQLMSGEFNLVSSLFGIPFLLGSILFWTLALMCIAGKVEVTIGRECSVFTGIGSLGWRRSFNWFGVNSISEAPVNFRYPGGHSRAIVLEGPKRVSFGTGLNSSRLYFVMQTLKYLKAAGKTR